MTGSNKVWRAPVAGLASVAMLATLGVSAMTANAADSEHAEYTVSVPGAQFIDKSDNDKLVESLKVEDTNDNGVLDTAELKSSLDYVSDVSEVVKFGAGVVNPTITGWFTTSEYGTADKYNVDVDPATDLYLHWAPAADIVTVKNDNTSFSDAGLKYESEFTLARQDGKLDQLAEWQLPVDAESWTGGLVDKYLINGKEYTSYPTSFGPEQITYGTNDVAVTAVPVDSSELVKVTFNAQGLTGTSGKDLALGNTDYTFVKTSSDSAARGFELRKGESFSDRYTDPLPTVYKIGETNLSTNKWLTYDGAKMTSAQFTADTKVNGNTNVYVSSADLKSTFTVTFDYDGDTLTTKDQKAFVVNGGDKINKPADATKADDEKYKYEFAGWHADNANTEDEAYDFNVAPTRDIVFTPLFKVSAVKFTYKLNYGYEKDITQWVSDGTFKVQDDPVRDGYTFNGWFAADNTTDVRVFDGLKFTIKSTPDLTPSAALHYSAMYTESAGVGGAGVADKTFSAGTTFTAKWTEITDPETTLADVEAITPKSLIYNDSNSENGFNYDQTVFTADSFKEFVDLYQDYVAAKQKALASGNVLTEAEAAELISQLQAAQRVLVFNTDKTVMRFEKNGVHLYSDSKKEQNNLIKAGWKHEKLGDFQTVNIKGLPEETVDGLLTTVSRLREKATGQYMLTADQNEINVLGDAWKNETASAIYTPKNGTVPVYRLYLKYNGEHLVTADQNEYDTQVKDTANFHGDGVKFYIY